MPMFEVRVCRTTEELHAVQRLRYEIYVEEMGRPQPHADHENRRITDDLDAHGHVLALMSDGALVGTMRLNVVADGIGKYEPWYGLSDLTDPERRRNAIGTALMLRPSVRGGGAITTLCRSACAMGKSLGVEACWLDCNEHVVPVFERYGYRSVGSFSHPLYGQVRLMRIDLLDAAHLTRLRSPLLPVITQPALHLPRNFHMNSMDRLRAEFHHIAAHFNTNPTVARLRRGDATVAEYASLMSAIALQTRENPQIQAYATAFFRGHQRDLVRAFCKHAVSEIGHDQLAADDVATLGFPVDALFHQQPLPSTTALTAFAYYTIDHVNPVGYLGYLFFLEFLPTAFGAEYLAALDKMGVPATARTFLMDHAAVDIGHNKLMERYVEQLIVTDADYEAVRYAMEVTGTLYARMVEESFARADQLGAARPLAPAERTRRLVATSPNSHDDGDHAAM